MSNPSGNTTYTTLYPNMEYKEMSAELYTDSVSNSSGLTTGLVQATKLDGKHRGESLPFMIEQVDGIFILLLLCFFFFAHIYHGGLGFIVDNYKMIFRKSHTREFNQTTSRETIFSYFLLIQSLLLIAITLYDTMRLYYPLQQEIHTPLTTILLFTLLLGCYMIVKMAIYKLEGYIFDMSSKMSLWRKNYLVIFEILGILFFFPTLFLVYADYGHIYLVSFMLALLLIAHIIYFYRRIYFFIAEKFNFLYLIAYLCTVEILPCVFLILGINYIYRFDVFKFL